MFCKNCGVQLKDGATFCTNCGTPVNAGIANFDTNDSINNTIIPEGKTRKPIYKAWWFWVVIAAALMILLACIGAHSRAKSMNQNKTITTPAPTSTAVQPSASAPTVKTSAPASASVKTSSTPSANATANWHKSGQYKVGTDIKAGEYFILAPDGYMKITSDSTGSLSSIIANDNIDTFRFITVTDGEYLTVEDGKFIEAANATVPKPVNGVYKEGMYRVGIDIPAGEYTVKSTNSEGAYIEITSDSTGNFDSIVTNDNIEGSTYITITDGQYIKVNDGEICATK